MFRQQWARLSCPYQSVQIVAQHGKALKLSSSSQFYCVGIDAPPQQTSASGDAQAVYAIRRHLPDTLRLAEAFGPGAGAGVAGEILVAAAGILRTGATALAGGSTAVLPGVGRVGAVADGKSVGCLVGVEFAGDTGAAKVTVKSANHALVERC